MRAPSRTKAINNTALSFHAETMSPRRRSAPIWVPPHKGHNQPVMPRIGQGSPQPVSAKTMLNPTPTLTNTTTQRNAPLGVGSVIVVVRSGKAEDSMYQMYIFEAEKTNPPAWRYPLS